MVKKDSKKYVFVVVCAFSIIFMYKAFNMSIFSTITAAFFPMIIGAILAYFLFPLVSKVENFIDRKTHLSMLNKSRTIASLFVFFVFVLVIVLLLIRIIPALIDYAVHISGNLTMYMKDFEMTIYHNLGHNVVADTIVDFLIVVEDYVMSLESVDPVETFNTVFKAGSTLLTLVLSLVFTPYILIETKHFVSIFDRFCSLFITDEQIKLIHIYAFRCHNIFGQFVYGKFIDSLIIGIIAFFGLMWIKVDFFPLLAVFILVTNMIPYFGPFIGGVPAVLVALMTGDLVQAIVVLIFVFALQQFDGLFLGPKILGDVVGISPFWILLSITVFGKFYGFIGMFLGVPLVCIIRMFFNDYVQFKNEMKAKE